MSDAPHIPVPETAHANTVPPGRIRLGPCAICERAPATAVCPAFRPDGELCDACHAARRTAFRCQCMTIDEALSRAPSPEDVQDTLRRSADITSKGKTMEATTETTSHTNGVAAPKTTNRRRPTKARTETGANAPTANEIVSVIKQGHARLRALEEEAASLRQALGIGHTPIAVTTLAPTVETTATLSDPAAKPRRAKSTKPRNAKPRAAKAADLPSCYDDVVSYIRSNPDLSKREIVRDMQLSADDVGASLKAAAQKGHILGSGKGAGMTYRIVAEDAPSAEDTK